MEATDTGRVPEAVVAEICERVDDGRLDLPVLPDVVLRLLALSLDDNDCAGDLARILGADPALAAEILRVANSPAYAGVAGIESLSQAIMRLGFLGLRQIALATALRATTFRSARFPERLEQLWIEALSGAFWAREIALVIRDNPDEAYLAGLLRDIGRPVALLALEQLEAPALAEDAALLDALALQLGARIGRAWALPEYVNDIIARRSNRYPALSGVIALAEDLIAAGEAVDEALISAHASARAVTLLAADVTHLAGYPPRLAEVVASS